MILLLKDRDRTRGKCYGISEDNIHEIFLKTGSKLHNDRLRSGMRIERDLHDAEGSLYDFNDQVEAVEKNDGKICKDPFVFLTGISEDLTDEQSKERGDREERVSRQ